MWRLWATAPFEGAPSGVSFRHVGTRNGICVSLHAMHTTTALIGSPRRLRYCMVASVWSCHRSAKCRCAIVQGGICRRRSRASTGARPRVMASWCVAHYWFGMMLWIIELCLRVVCQGVTVCGCHVRVVCASMPRCDRGCHTGVTLLT